MGEIFVGGAGLARGYLNRPDLTATRFLPSPFSAEPGARLYRTGDAARFCADGKLAFLGRLDNQVKIRGFRIELGEIEAALETFESVTKAVVIVREDQPGDRRLTAYVTTTSDSDEVDPGAELRAKLAETLPVYMLPASFVHLDRIPLTINGKIDYRALPAPAADGRPVRDQVQGPRNRVEQILCRIWSEILRMEEIGIHDNFFELGGDSILTIQVISRAKSEGLIFTPRMIFEDPTIAGLAARTGEASAVVAEQGVVTGSLPLTPIQRDFFERSLPFPNHFNQSLMLHLPVEITVATLQSALNHLAEHHDTLRLRFGTGPDGPLQEITAPGDSVPLSVHDIEATNESERHAAIAAIGNTIQASLDMENGPLLRTALLRLPAGLGHRLLMAVHHLAVDGVSWRILAEDLESLCHQLAAGEEPQLPPKTTSFKQWAHLLEEYGQSESIQARAAYWLALGDRKIAGLPLIADGESGSVVMELDTDVTTALLQQVPAAYRTRIDDVLLTAMVLGLRSVTESEEGAVMVAMENHGREAPAGVLAAADLTRTVGWFTSIYPMVLETEPGMGPGDALKFVKEQIRNIPGKGLSYGILRCFAPEQVRESLASIGPAQIAFNYLGQTDRQAGNDSLLRLAEEPHGRMVDPRNGKHYPLTFTAVIADGRLRMNWLYAGNLAKSLVCHLAEAYQACLEQIIQHCSEPDTCGYTPSDFPLAQLDSPALDRLCGHDREIEDVYPLTPAQEGMLFHILADPNRNAYLFQSHYRITGEVDLAALKQAWEEVISRHPILRTTFHWRGLDRPHQVVHTRAELPWFEHDWRHLDTESLASHQATFLERDTQQGWEPDSLPLLRCQVIHLPNVKGQPALRFIMSTSHLLVDGWSMPILFRELFACYNAFKQRQPLDLKAVAPFRNYLVWLAERNPTEAADWWRTYLAGFEAPTPLPGARLAAGEAMSRQARLEMVLPLDTLAELNTMARRYRLTTNTLVQGAWSLLLGRYAGETDVVFGATVSGRPGDLDGVVDMLGMFINTLPVRVDLDPGQKLGDLLKRIHTGHMEANTFAFSPLVGIHKNSSLPPGSPLFESIVVYENFPMDDAVAEFRDPLIDDFSGNDPTNYPLTLVVFAGPQGLVFKINFDAGRFDAQSIAVMSDRLRRLLVAMPEHGDQAISRLPMLTDNERAQVLCEWNDTASEYPRDQTIAGLFAAVSMRHGNRVAVIMAGDRQGLLPAKLTYEALNDHADRMAAYLAAMGVGPESLVGLCLARSPEMLVCILAILKAGGAYVPLDPDYPSERLSFMMSDAGLSVLITQKDRLDLFPAFELNFIQTLVLEEDWAEIGTTEPMPEPVALGSDQPAYVMYTSGSTGKPKGVMVPHRAISRLVFGADYAGLGEDTIMLHMAPISFDASTLEVWGSLLRGGRCVLFPEGPFLTPALGAVLGEHQINTLWLTAALCHMVIDEAPEILTGVRYLLAGGDVLSADHIVRAQAALPNTTIINGYGPTESTTFACCFPIPDGFGHERIPIGAPIANTRAYVLDSALEPLPTGLPGELYLAGDGLARGYHNRGGLTAERFLPCPYGPVPGARMYRSGDLARWRDDGTLDFIGRRDNQVKVRGFRIETGEIEATLLQHAKVEEAAVVVRGSAAGKQLVGYLQASDEETASAESAEAFATEIRSFLSERLPAHMVPTLLHPMTVLPLTPNQKVDRRALAALDPGSLTREEAYLAPETATECALAEILQDLLEVARVGMRDNFFELGGHSLLIPVAISRIEDRFHMKLPYEVLMNSHDIGTFAQRLDRLIQLDNPESTPEDEDDDLMEMEL